MFPRLETRQFIIFINPVQQQTLIHFESIFELYAPHAMLFVLLPIFELENEIHVCSATLTSWQTSKFVQNSQNPQL